MSTQAQDEAPPFQAPPSKRRRISLACNACRVRKSRCDGQRPSCSSCVGLGFVCHYEPTDATANVLVRKESLADLESRLSANERGIDRLDKLLKCHLQNCAESTANGGMGPPQRSVGSDTGLPPDDGSFRADVLEEPQDEDATMNGMAMTFTEERTSAYFGESSNLHFTRVLLRATAAFHQSPSTTAKMNVDNQSIMVEGNLERMSQFQSSPVASFPRVPNSALTALPSEARMESLLDTYFSTIGVVFPIIHEETLRNAYAEFKSKGYTAVRRTWLGTLNMMFAMACQFDQSDGKRRIDHSIVFYERAKGLCDNITKTVISIEIVHYLVLVVIHCQGTQRSIQAWNTHGVLVRSAIALGLHSEHHRKGLAPIIQETYRRTWMVIYGLDKVLSVVFGRPCAIMDAAVLTRQLSSWPSYTPRDSPSSVNDLPGQFINVSFTLYQLMGLSLIKQYGAVAEATNVEADDLASLQATDELRKALRSWASNLPSHLQLCTPQSTMLLETNQANRLRVILTLRYHNLNILVHRPLLSSTLSRASHADNMRSGTSPYVFQLAVAGAYECVHSAETTIDIIHFITSSDPTSNNNLGVHFWTLYYAFTASLVICGRWLLAKYGQAGQSDEAAIASCQNTLSKAQSIFQSLGSDDALVDSCSRYISNLSDLFNSRGPTGSEKSGGEMAGEADFGVSAGHTQSGMLYNGEGLDTFEFMTSDLLEPAAFEGFGWAHDGTLRGVV